MPIELKEVTVCAVGSKDRLLAGRALDICNGHCRFADSILFSHEPVEGTFRNVAIEQPQSMAAYTRFLLRDLNTHIQTPFVLVTQWDGYVTNPASWKREFLDYDYIGAVWYWHKENKVGNGGFSLRSKKLLEAMCDAKFELHETHDGKKLGEDDLICRLYRPLLEQKYGIRFAPEVVAERFAYERSVPRGPTFGFHGLFNFWREVSDSDLTQMMPLMPPSTLQHLFCAELLAFYFQMQRWTPMRTLYSTWRSHFSFEDVSKMIRSSIHPQIVSQLLDVAESLLGTA